MHFLPQSTILALLYLIASTTASPFALKHRQTDPAIDSDEHLSAQCLYSGDREACNQMHWSPSLVAFLRKTTPPGAVGSGIQPSNSTAPPSVQAMQARKRNSPIVQMPGLEESYEEYLADVDEKNGKAGSTVGGAADKEEGKVGSTSEVPGV